MLRFVRAVYLQKRLFWALGGATLLFVLGYAWAPVYYLAVAALLAIAGAVTFDMSRLWTGGGLTGDRQLEQRLSLGDANPIRIVVDNGYSFACRVMVMDELPIPFYADFAGGQEARARRPTILVPPRAQESFSYAVRPLERGKYHFGHLLLYASGPLGLVQRRFSAEQAASEIDVYPSRIQMERFAFLAAHDRLTEAGVKPVRRLGHAMEFDQVRTYVIGDDMRTINWKATARSRGLMVNQYREERAQPVYAALDMGRVMESSFEGMRLLDYAVNASLVLLNTAQVKGDRIGLAAFDSEVRVALTAGRDRAQLGRVLEALYALQPDFRDPNFEALYRMCRLRLSQRGLMILFSNFDTMSGLKRRLPVLRRIGRLHRLVVVLFENVELEEERSRKSRNLTDVYIRTITEELVLTKREIALALEREGISAVLTSPDALTVDVLNRYLAIKARGSY